MMAARSPREFVLASRADAGAMLRLRSRPESHPQKQKKPRIDSIDPGLLLVCLLFVTE
jgi:hypothetical protein